MSDPESRHESGNELSDAAETVLHPIEDGDSGPITDPVPEGAAREMVIEVIGPYEVLEEIARGGMGVVYRARHRELGRAAALKLIRSGVGAGEEERRRFHIEASALARLEHPHIVPLYEAGEHAGQPFLAMAFIDGAPLSARVQQGPMRPTEAVGMLHQVAEAIEAAHAQGIVHRDLKPANILIDSRGQPRVTDFGLAKQEQTPESLTLSGQILGTPGYMPPEQAEGSLSAVGPRSDVYALGAVLYAMLTGRPPFQSATPLDTLRQHVKPESLMLIDSSDPQLHQFWNDLAVKPHTLLADHGCFLEVPTDFATAGRNPQRVHHAVKILPPAWPRRQCDRDELRTIHSSQALLEVAA